MQPLADLRVLELTQGIAGPACTRLLADFGADVLKVEPPGGDSARAAGPFPGDLPHPEKSGLYLHLNLNKRNVVLDLETAAGRSALLDLLGWAEVLVTPGALPFDLPPPAPGAAPVRVAITPFGLTGPYRDWKATDFLIFALSGGMITTGVPSREPLKQADGLMAYHAGVTAAVATLGAVLAWRRSGRPQTVDLSLYEAATANPDRRLLYLVGYAYTGWSATREASGERALPDGTYPCRDGFAYIAVSPNDRWPRFVRMLGHPELLDDPELNAPDAWTRPSVKERLDALFYSWLAEHTKQEVMQAAQAERVPGTAVNTPLDLLDDPHLRARDFWRWADHPVAGRLPYTGPPFRMARDAWQIRRLAPTLTSEFKVPSSKFKGSALNLELGTLNSELPLAGIRILDLTLVLAGPMVTLHLADLGAEVIRVESLQHFPPHTRGIVMRPSRQQLAQLGQQGRLYADRDPGARPWNRNAYANSLGRNKRSMTVNLRTPEGVALVKRLTRVADVLVENNTPGLLARLGLGPAELCALNPALIYVSMPIFGTGGPYADYLGYGANAEAISGLASLRGYRDGDVSLIGRSNYMDTASGAGAAFATLVALADRARTGLGQHIEFAQIENLLFQLGAPVMDAAMNRRYSPPLGNRDPMRAPQGVYPCAGDDRWLALSIGSDAEWAALCRFLDRPDWAESPEYRGDAARRRHHDTLDTAIAAWTRDKDARWLMNTLQMHSVPAAIVAHDEDVFVDPHLRAREFFIAMAHPEAGRHDYPGFPYHWPGTPRPSAPPPCLGEHNEYVYKELLGFTAAEYADWEAAGHIGRDYLIP